MSHSNLRIKILLINPPIEDFYQTKLRQQPLGLRYIQSALENADYETQFIDCLDSNQKRAIPLPAQFHYLKKYYPLDDLSPFKLFTHYRHFGLSFEQLENQLRAIDTPDFIGISVNFTPYFDMALETARLCKFIFPETPVIAGGHHATAEPASVLESIFFDYVVLGEGEQVILKLIDTLVTEKKDELEKIEGLAFRTNHGIHISQSKTFIQNLDTIPSPPLDNSVGMIITSRGCPKNCNFCSISKVMGKKVRFRSVTSVLREMEQGVEKGITRFDFEDDNLTINQDRAKEFFRQIIQQFGQGTLKLSALNGILADTLDEELVQLMRRAGFEWLNIPMVSGSAKMHERIDRFQSRHKFMDVISWGKKYGLKMVAYIILGLPEDKPDQMLEDIIYLAYLPVLIGPSMFYPPPGSVSFQNCVEQNYISGKKFTLYRSTALPVETANFSRTDIVTLFRLVRAINYIKQIFEESPEIQDSMDTYLARHRQTADELVFTKKLDRNEIGGILLDQLLNFRKLRGLSLTAGSDNLYRYMWIDYEINHDLVDRWNKNLEISKVLPVL